MYVSAEVGRFFLPTAMEGDVALMNSAAPITTAFFCRLDVNAPLLTESDSCVEYVLAEYFDEVDIS